VKAVTPRCGVWPNDTSSGLENDHYHNFGCASQQNFAAMIANPADLVRPREMAPSHGARRAKVISDYGQGNDTKSNVVLISSDLGD